MKYTCNMSLLRYVQEARLMTTLFPGSFISPAPPPGGGLTPSYGLYRDLPAGQGMVFASLSQASCAAVKQKTRSLPVFQSLEV